MVCAIHIAHADDLMKNVLFATAEKSVAHKWKERGLMGMTHPCRVRQSTVQQNKKNERVVLY